MQERAIIQSDRPSYMEKPQYHLWVRNTPSFTTSKPHPLPNTRPSSHRNGEEGKRTYFTLRDLHFFGEIKMLRMERKTFCRCGRDLVHHDDPLPQSTQDQTLYKGCLTTRQGLTTAAAAYIHVCTTTLHLARGLLTRPSCSRLPVPSRGTP